MKPPAETGFTLTFCMLCLSSPSSSFLLALEACCWHFKSSEARRGSTRFSAFFFCGRPIGAPVLRRIQSGPARLTAALLNIRLSRYHGSTEQSWSTCEQRVLFPNSSLHLFAVSASASYPMPRRRLRPPAHGELGWSSGAGVPGKQRRCRRCR
jgi:hypothetical protein